MSGTQANYPVQNIGVRLFDGSYHDVDSDAFSFELCSRLAFRHSARKAGPELLEPVMTVEVTTPEDAVGDVIGLINSRRGTSQKMENNVDSSVAKAKLPLAETFVSPTESRSL